MFILYHYFREAVNQLSESGSEIRRRENDNHTSYAAEIYKAGNGGEFTDIEQVVSLFRSVEKDIRRRDEQADNLFCIRRVKFQMRNFRIRIE